jgi:two-component system, OmpR family, osmolarity sensor histidine kinase EnvZ
MRFKPTSLFGRTALVLALAFVLFLVAAFVVIYRNLVLPVAEQSADDLAALIVLSAQTWVELPPETRPDFENELATRHGLRLMAQPIAKPVQAPKFAFKKQIVQALSDRINRTVVFSGRSQDHSVWAEIPVGGHTLYAGFFPNRYAVHPPLAAATLMSLGAFLVLLTALVLVRRITVPLARAAKAADQVGAGRLPVPLPETGPHELAELARRFNQMSREVQALLENRTTLLAGVSHDLRTPITRAQLSLEMLKDAGGTELERNGRIGRIATDLADMNTLIGGYLDLARSFKAEEPQDVELAGELEELALRVGGVKIEAQHCPVHVGRQALRRIVTNLLENAQRYGGGEITLKLEREKNRVRIQVHDNGPGIPEDELGKVFRPFYRLEASRAKSTGGTGLGLAVVKQLAEANGWEIFLRNRTEGGLEAELVIEVLL